MQQRHFRFDHHGYDLDTGAEYAAAALITIDDEHVTYTLRSTTDRRQSRRFQVSAAEAGLLLNLLAAIEDLCRIDQDRQRV